MEAFIECPACKTTFRGQLTGAHNWFICPCCQCQFNVVHDGVHEAAVEAPPLPAPAPHQPPTVIPTVVPVQETGGDSGGLYGSDPYGSDLDSIELSGGAPNGEHQDAPTAFVLPSAPRAIRYRRKTNSQATALVLLGALAFLVLFGMIVQRVMQEPDERVAKSKVPKELVQPRVVVRPPRRPSVAVVPRREEPTDDMEPEDSPEEMSLPEPATEEPEPEPAADTPVRSLLEVLDQSGRLCEAFQFLPADDVQYEQFQDFALQLSLAKGLLADGHEGELNPNDKKTLTERSAHWLRTMKAILSRAARESPRRLSHVNAFAKRALEKRDRASAAGSRIIFYGCVFLKAAEDHPPVLKLERKQVYFSVPAGSGFDSSDEKSYRMIIVEIPEAASPQRRHSPGGGLIQVMPANPVYSFDPLDTTN